MEQKNKSGSTKITGPFFSLTIPDIDDKTLVIVAVTIIACWVTGVLESGEAKNVNAIVLIASNAFSGLFGLAVGRALAKEGRPGS